jgi:two-component system, OmpR family, sensor histidine kinase CreC
VSTTTRILLGFLLLLAGGLYFLLSVLNDRVQRQYLEAAEEPMVDAAHLFAALIEQYVDESGTYDFATIRQACAAARERKFRAQIYDFTKTAINMHVYVTDRDGVVLFDSDGGKAEGKNYRNQRDVALTLAGGYGARATRADPKVSMSATLFVAAPVWHGGEIAGVVSVSKPQRSMFEFIEQTRWQIRWLTAVFFLVIVLGAVVIASVFARPIRRLADYARAVARGERATPPRHGAPEVVALGRAFEEMRDALEDRKYVETYVQTLTHEMKSPLAAIRGAAELVQEEAMPPERRAKFLVNIRAETHRLQNQIDRLLALSAIESRKRLEKPEVVPLDAVAEKVCAEMKPAAEAREVTLVLERRAEPRVRGEEFLLEMALGNLLQNALDFSPAQSVVRVVVSESEGWAEVCVEDHGPGIPDYAVERVFDRFYSLQHPATGRKSSGLGLCFVREAAELHGGEARLENRGDDPGARATLRLPALK